MRHILRAVAHEFYYDELIDKIGSWGAAVAVFNEAYSSESKMDAVLNGFDFSRYTTMKAKAEVNAKL